MGQLIVMLISGDVSNDLKTFTVIVSQDKVKSQTAVRSTKITFKPNTIYTVTELFKYSAYENDF